MKVFTDESGCLGWKFDSGSSRFLTLGFIKCYDDQAKLDVNRLVRKTYRKFKTPQSDKQKGRDLKGNGFNQKQRVDIARKFKRVVEESNGSILIDSITVNKKQCMSYFRDNPDALYYWIMKEALIPRIHQEPRATIIADERSVKLKYLKQPEKYFRDHLRKKYKSKCDFKFETQLSHTNLSLIAADWLTNMIWRHYELRDHEAYGIISDLLEEEKKYFFGKTMIASYDLDPEYKAPLLKTVNPKK